MNSSLIRFGRIIFSSFRPENNRLELSFLFSDMCQSFSLRFARISLQASSFIVRINASRFSLICADFPQLFSPSGHFPRRQAGPAFRNRLGAVLKQIINISSAILRISHCARIHILSEKKCLSSLTFIVMIILVSQAFGKTNLASSFELSPLFPNCCCQSTYQDSIVSICFAYFLTASSPRARILSGIIYPNPFS